MCMDRQDWKTKVPKEGVGYKWLRKDADGLCTPYMKFCIKRGRWQKSAAGELRYDGPSSGTYASGFHLFTKYAEAKKSDWGADSIWYETLLYRVAYRKVLAVGWGDGLSNKSHQIVVGEMKVLGLAGRVKGKKK